MPVTAALILAILASHVTGNDWLEEPYGDDSFNTRAEFNTNVTLECNESYVPGSAEFRYWISPDLTIMRQNYTSSFRTLDGIAGWEVSSDGIRLLAFLIQEAHFGFYYCIKESPTDDVLVIKKGINYQGPYWGDLWKKYETQTIVALSASGGFLAFAILIGITWHFRYKGEITEEDDGKHGIEEYSNALFNKNFDNQDISQYTNAGFEPIEGVGFIPVSPVDVHCVTGEPVATTSKTAASAF